MPDFLIADHGSIITIAPVSEAARDWIDENVTSEPWQSQGGALCVDHRYAGNLIKGIADEGFDHPAEHTSRAPDASRMRRGLCVSNGDTSNK
jgi:hypothetical protein